MFLMATLPAAMILSATCTAATEGSLHETVIEITATHDAEAVVDVPASISVVSGDELRRRGANDLRTALALLAGVEGTPGGDGGPAGTVPSLWGLREADAFLLVVDEVPWGGAFNPATPSVDLSGVERIEVLRGAAPVMYGATSFVGVIHIIHYAAGDAPRTLGLSAGSPGSYGAAATLSLAPLGEYRQSLTLNLEQRDFAEDRARFKRAHALYRGARDLGGTKLRIDADISILPQRPSGNLLLRDGRTAHSELGVDVNFNPAGARLDQQRYHLAASLEGQSALGTWSTTLAVTRSFDDMLRGFLRGESFNAPPDAGVGDGFQADGYTQQRRFTDVYFDAHLARDPAPGLRLTFGVDHLHGSGSQNAVNFGYCVNAAGIEQVCDGAHHADEIVRSGDSRDFSGAYAQLDWRPVAQLDLMAGVRLNHTRESADGLAIDNTGAQPVVAFDGTDARTTTRLSGLIGASWHAWSAGADALTLYADYRNSFKPLAIDFGPEAEVQVLRPETANSYELGVKTQLLGGALDLDASIFNMDFRNGLTYADDGAGNFMRANGGATRFRGFEIESRYALTTALQLYVHFAQHDARFVSFTRDNGADASGNRFEMSPRQQAGFGLVYAPATGFSGSVIAGYTGSRFLNKSNSVAVGGYTSVDATLGYRLGKYDWRLNGYNLGDRRDPVAESDLQEAVSVTGTAGYYRLPGRALVLSLNLAL
jgi:outer membrane receptor protein involved in Fe transport